MSIYYYFPPNPSFAKSNKKTPCLGQGGTQVSLKKLCYKNQVSLVYI